MAAYAALLSLVNNIHQIINHPRLSSSLDKKEIQPLLEKADFLLDFVEKNNYGGGSKEAEHLERQIAFAAHAAEDVIESHIVDQINAGTNQATLECSPDLLQQIIEDMDAVMERANELKEKDVAGEKQSTHSRPVMEISGETAMVGFDEELTQLLDELTSHQSSRYTISIIGMGGMGKTTLAKNVHQNLLIMQHFDIRAWATVSQKHNVEEILSQLLSGQGKPSHGTVDELGEKLHKTLTGRRYLMILDDIWSVDVWDKVRRFFPDNGNGSRVVLTTRLSNVAIDCCSSCFWINPLDEDKSWRLFCKKAFQQEDCPPQLEEVGREIVELCKGLPLSIVVIGGRLLKSPRTVGYWRNVAKDIKSIPNSKEKQESIDVLFSSYSHLPAHLKPCFLYMGVYGRGFAIRVSKIIKLWVAEGFIKSDGARVLEEIAKDYLKDLNDRNLISVGTRRGNGKMKSCDIHDLLRDLCLKVSEQQEFVYLAKGEIRGTERRLILGTSMPGTGLPLARSILTFGADLQQVLYNCRLMRVLDEYWSSSEGLCRGVNLRYLAYKHQSSSRWGDQGVLELPSSVSLIWNLQTLIVRKEYLSSPIVVAPTEIWTMRQLRHVECRYIYLPDPPPSDGEENLLNLENLQTLETAPNLRLSEEVCKIIPNIKKLHLAYDHTWRGYDDGLLQCLCNLNRLHKLESLRLVMLGEWPVSDTKLNKILTFPHSLNKLCLSQCQLDWEDLTMIGSLPQLEVLNLVSLSVKDGEEWSPIDGQFLRLKFLKIDSCDLACWNAESCHFPILEKLVLCNLLKLEEIPRDIGEIPTLKLIRLYFCSVSVAISAVKIKEDQLETQGDDDLQIQVRMRHYDLKSFREMVETEELTINNIQLE
ncbi:hypothetical protein C2S51_006825 [Perilla frutescens var. frutescens]|nr:hypothetical protein C2S51_006825 [Perilla frutescens var. frutescens]